MSTKTKTKEKAPLFTLHGFTVREGSTYLIKDKPDGDAPSGFVAARVSKLPSDGIDEVFSPRFIPVSPDGKQGNWDTGFYEFSPCYKGMDSADVKTIVKNLRAKVLEPYRKAIGDDNALEHSNPTSLKNTLFRVYSGRVFNTDDPIDTIELYFALQNHQVTPAGEEGNSRFRDSFYVVVDTTKTIKDADEQSMNLFSAISKFEAIFNEDQDKLAAILSWINFRYTKGIDKGALTTLFFKEISQSNQKCQIFLDSVEEYNTANGMHKLRIHKILKEKSLKGTDPQLKKSPNGTYFYGDQEIGPDLKTAAENISKNSQFENVKNILLHAEN